MTGKVRFIGAEFSHAVAQPAILGDKATPEAAARGFLSTYGSLFGLKDQARELKVMRSKTAARGRSFVRFQQHYSDVPILGGELVVQMDSFNNILSANGEILPEILADTSPSVSAAEAQGKALALVLKYYSQEYAIERGSLKASKPELWIYNPILLGLNRDSTHLVWRMEVYSTELLPIRELVLIDAHLGHVVLHFNQIDTARNRLIYDHNNDWTKPFPSDPADLARSEGGGPSPITDVNNAYDYAGDWYDFYWTRHGRDSIDGAGMDLVSTTRFCPNLISCPFVNAFWSGSQMVYGEGFASADDVVGHEMTHGVTMNESGLFYYMQAGAINEALSDIWGEFIDLTNGKGTDTAGVRWELGEDLPIGAIRDMEDPTLFGDPDRIGSPNYFCGSGDNGGVHYNSGVANKMAYLLTDGGTFNGYVVTGLGIDKVADLFYEVQTNLLTSGSDYQDLYDALLQAAVNLGFSASDRQQVRNAVNATEMNQQPSACPNPEAPIVDSGSPVNLFFDDLENPGSGNWTHGAIVGVDEWYYPQPALPPGPRYATSGQYNFWGWDQWDASDTYMAMTFDVSLPAGTAPYMHFKHAYEFEVYLAEDCDGGVVEYSTDGGFNCNDAGPLFIDNGYNGTLSINWGNPLGGRQAFVNSSNGYSSSRLGLSSLAGQDVRFRFRMGTDEGGDFSGWFIDDIRIYIRVGTPLSDFDADSNPDILWRNTSGSNAIWYMDTNGTSVKGWASVPGCDPSWQAGGVADFDSDGVPDIFLRHTSGSNAIWYMEAKGMGVRGWASVPGCDPSWQLDGVGDFDVDGVPDIFWRHTSGSNAIWYMDTNGTSVKSWSKVPGCDPIWQLDGVGDFDADGVPDIFWRHTSGSNAIWYMNTNGTSVKSWSSVPSCDPSWQVGKIADYDADAVPDILWRHTSGSNAIWYMDTNGTAVKSWTSVPSAGPSWDVGG
jgi:Zn-dependent metalloprotease